MTDAKLADRIRMNQKSRSPVQDTVDKLFDDITEAMAEGGSYRTVHAQLTREGHNVGKRHNSLFTAYKIVKRRRDQQPAALPHAAGTPQGHIPLGMTAEGSGSNLFGQMPTAVIDTRRKIGEW